MCTPRVYIYIILPNVLHRAICLLNYGRWSTPSAPGRSLESVDGAAVQLLPLLDWRPVLQALAPLQDVSAGRAPAGTVQWASEFVLFALKACVLLQQEVWCRCVADRAHTRLFAFESTTRDIGACFCMACRTCCSS